MIANIGPLYEATIIQKLPNKRHRTKRIRFFVPSGAKRVFFELHPEYNKPDYAVIIRCVDERLGCVKGLNIGLSILDSTLAWVQREYPKAEDRKRLAKHLTEYAKKIKSQL
jgi:hypothetical protein